MDKTRERHNNKADRAASRANVTKNDLGHTNIDGLMASYLTAAESDHHSHHLAAETILGNAFIEYGQHVERHSHQTDVSQHTKNQIEERFSYMVDQAAKLSMPPDVIGSISEKFFNFALDYDNPIAPELRHAAVRMGTAIGSGPDVQGIKASIVKTHHDRAIDRMRRGEITDAQYERAKHAEDIIQTFNYSIEIAVVPSISESVSQFTKDHAKNVGMTGAAVVLAASIATPTMASASESSSKIVQSTQSTVSRQIQTTVEAAPVIPSLHTKVPRSVISSVPTSVETTVKATISLPKTAETAIAPSIVVSQPEQTETTVEATVAATPDDTEIADHNQSTVIAGQTDAPVETIATIALPTAPAESAPTGHTVDADKLTEQQPNINLNKLAQQSSSITSVETTPAPESGTPQTKAQRALQIINGSIVQGGDVGLAANLLRQHFHTGVVTENDAEGAVVPVTDQALVDNLAPVTKKLVDVIHSGAHTDPTYVKNALMAVSVLNAAAHDQTILSSEDVKNLVSSVGPSADQYQAKLYAQIADQTKTTLEANNSALLAGIDQDNQPQIMNLYTYTMMATMSDTEQATEIQKIKDTEAAAAAAAAAAASNSNGSAENEAIADMVTSSNGVSQLRYKAMQFFMNKGLTATQAAGIVGNLSGESGMRTSVKEVNNSGLGRGLAQWTYGGGRWKGLVAYAESRGTSWDDWDTQLEYIWIELHGGYSGALHNLQAAQNVPDAVFAIMHDYEVPQVVVDGQRNPGPMYAQRDLRLSLIHDEFDAYNNKLNAINQARAEAARQYKLTHGMTIDEAKTFMNDYKNNPSNEQYIGGAGRTCNGGPLSNCVSFSMYFLNKYTTIGGDGPGTMPGNGSTVVQHILERNHNVQTGTTPRVNAIFSTPSGSMMCGDVLCGHTGVILGVDQEHDQVVVGEAGCGADSSWDTARIYSYSQFNSGRYHYAYTDGLLKTDVTP